MVVIASAIYMLMPSLEGRANCWPGQYLMCISGCQERTFKGRSGRTADHEGMLEQTH